MSREALLQLLGERLGLDPASFGERVVDHALGQVRDQLQVCDDAALWKLARRGGAALACLVDAFLVPETWFFRVPEQFRELADFARTTARARRPLRVLSLPCSTGEEAWSAAISLLEAGLQPSEIDVLGIDVSATCIERAQRGLYRGDSGRRPLPGSPWMEHEGEAWRIAPLLRRCVRFRQGNALDPHLFMSGERFDAVFCRHLLIYLHAAARRQLLEQIVRVLQPPALVLAGQAELLSTMLDGFAPLPGGSPVSFVWGGAVERVTQLAAPRAAGREPSPDLPVARRAGLAPSQGAPIHGHSRDDRPSQPLSRDAAATRSQQSASGVPRRMDGAVSDAAPMQKAANSAPSAQVLADAGQLDAARQACVADLQRRPDDVAALFLLATLESARGDLAAADAALGRVLYLAPEHLEALEHRIALARRQGREDDAVRLRARAQRLRQRLGEQA